MSDPGLRPVLVGCSGWNYAHWRERVYPKGLPPKRWLEHYATLFDTVEVNATFYRLPLRSSVARWVEQTPPDFLFAVKASRYLSHLKRLTDLGAGLERFYERIEPLVDSPKLGPVLWQLPANFHRNDDRLAGALAVLPPGRHCFEFRHPSWFADDVYALLREHEAALVIGDTPQRPFQTHEHRGLDVSALPLRPPGQERELLGVGARGMGAPDRRLAARRRRVRVLQQRLGGVRRPERARAQGTAVRR